MTSRVGTGSDDFHRYQREWEERETERRYEQERRQHQREHQWDEPVWKSEAAK